jgi:DNA polymerase alpha subunit B N-terminal
VIALSESLNISTSDMAECWEAYSLTKNVTSLDSHSFPAFRLKLMKDVENPVALAALVNDDRNSAVRVTAYKRDMSSAVITPAHLNNRKRPSTTGSDDDVSTSADYRRISLSPTTPAISFSSTRTTTFSSSAPQTTYGERQGAGKVVVSYTPSSRTDSPTTAVDGSATSNNKGRPKCIISTAFDTNALEPYRHWFTVFEDRSMALDLQLRQHSDFFDTHYNFGSEQIAALEAIGIPRQETICCIGRICNAVRLSHEGRVLFCFNSNVPNFCIRFLTGT